MLEIIAVLIPLIAFVVPMLVMFVIYAAILALVIWFIITFLNNQKERNRLLANIVEQLKGDSEEESELVSSIKHEASDKTEQEFN